MLTPAPTNMSRRRASAHLCCMEMVCMLLSMNVDKRGKTQIMVIHKDVGRWFMGCYRRDDQKEAAAAVQEGLAFLWV